MWTSSPYRSRRKAMDSYYTSTAREHPDDPNLARRLTRNRANAEANKHRPKKDTPTMLLPINKNKHWTFAIRQCRPRKLPIRVFYQDSFNSESTEHRATYLAMNQTPITNGNHAWIPVHVPGQTNLWDCGAHLLLHAYVWLYHPAPDPGHAR